MHNLGLGDLEFSSKHTLDEHRPIGYIVPSLEFDNNEFYHESNSTSNVNSTEHANNETSYKHTANADSTDSVTNPPITPFADESIIKIMNEFDAEKQEGLFRTMHDPLHRHPRHRGESLKWPNRHVVRCNKSNGHSSRQHDKKARLIFVNEENQKNEKHFR